MAMWWCIVKEWEDLNLRWDPKEYGGIKTFEIPSEEIWLPEMVLFNKWVLTNVVPLVLN